MTTFYSDPSVGGDGSYTTDDNDPTTGLGNGGFWTRLLPMFTNIVKIANFTKGQASAAVASANTAINSPGTSATSPTAFAIGTGQKNYFFLAQTGKLFSVGQQVMIASAANANNWMFGTITSFNSATGQMGVNVTGISGSGTFSDWVVSLSGPMGEGAVLLSTTTIGSAVASVSLPNVFSSAFDKYTIELYNVGLASSALLLLQLAKAGAAITTSSYASANANGAVGAMGTSLQVGNVAQTQFTLTIEVRNVNAATVKSVGSRGLAYTSSTYNAVMFEGVCTDTAVVTGFQLSSTVNLITGTIRVYGHPSA